MNYRKEVIMKNTFKVKVVVSISGNFLVSMYPDNAEYYLPKWSLTDEPVIFDATVKDGVLDVDTLRDDICIEIAEQTEVDVPHSNFEVQIYELYFDIIDIIE